MSKDGGNSIVFDSTKHSESEGATMLPFLMQRGPYEEVYFAERSETGTTQIVSLTFKEKDKLTRKVVKSYPNEKLYAMSLKLDRTIADPMKSHTLYLLDSDYTYAKLRFEDTDTDPTIEFEMNLKMHEQISDLCKYLNETEWTNLIVSTRGISSLKYFKAEVSEQVV
jgi:hypothetical protein